MSKYNLFVETADRFIPYKVEGTHGVLPTGSYYPEVNEDTGQVIFNKLALNSDDIVDLPSKEYDFTLNQMKHFLKPETKAKYKEEGFLYKRSILLHGKPGTGKTCLVSRIAKEALANDAIVLFNPEPQQMTAFFEALEATAPEKLTLVIFEEFDDLTSRGHTEKALLSILDGEIQKRNIIYLATTNHIDQVPLRMQRPGRFSSIIEVNFPSVEARTHYLKSKKVSPDTVRHWVEATEGFSIDELKETVLAVKCLDEKLETVVGRIKQLKEKGLEAESRKKENPRTPEEVLESIFGAVSKPARKW